MAYREMSDIVLHWEDLQNKIVTAKDKRIGRIIETSDNSIVLLDRRRFKYNVPKFHIKQYNGYEVFLDFSSNQLKKYQIAS
jgi:hypothetical protein